MIGGVTGSVNDSLGGVKEFEVIQVKAPIPNWRPGRRTGWTRCGAAFALQPSTGLPRLKPSDAKYA